MKALFKTLLALIICVFSFSEVEALSITPHHDSLFHHNNHADLLATLGDSITMDEFLEMTPVKYIQLTGKKLGVKKAIQLRVAQKMLRRDPIRLPRIQFEYDSPDKNE